MEIYVALMVFDSSDPTLMCQGHICRCLNSSNCLHRNISIPFGGHSKDQASSTTEIIVGACAGALSFLVIAVILTLLYLRQTNNITLIKLLHWFKDFEEDDTRTYDAFVSFASSNWDTDFVVHTLIPMLEGRHHFRLCVHQRDFLPGHFITENITSAVRLSRRTLLLVTPAYLDSEWCRFEYQVALQEMMSERHRILPVIVGDVTELRKRMSDTLDKLIKSVTWLEYPGVEADQRQMDKFWTRLVLSMPKKRQQNNDDIPDDRELNYV